MEFDPRYAALAPGWFWLLVALAIALVVAGLFAALLCVSSTKLSRRLPPFDEVAAAAHRRICNCSSDGRYCPDGNPDGAICIPLVVELEKRHFRFR